jgi:hypothetical protein
MAISSMADLILRCCLAAHGIHIQKLNQTHIQARTYDVQRPLGHPIIKDLIVKQWFASGKGEGIRHPSAKLFKNIPPTLIALVLTSVSLYKYTYTYIH